ncbi:hypothetical protein OG21DRAFT_1503924 [Imleria badia]|nr:hypothetical protein OG21DRAFT_1503924 [Imleria badia]
MRDAQRYWQANSGIDTAFGFSGQSRSTLKFANAEAGTLPESALEMPQAVIVTTEFADTY